MGQYSSFKEALSDLIKKKGKSNAEIGRLLGGISGQRIGQYLAGGRNPKPDFFKKWKKAFNEDLQEMIKADDETNDSFGLTNDTGITLKHYIESLQKQTQMAEDKARQAEDHSKDLKEIILKKLDKIDEIDLNSRLSAAGIQKVILDTDSLRTVALQSLSRLEKKPGDALLQAADNIKVQNIARSKKQNIATGDGKNHSE